MHQTSPVTTYADWLRGLGEKRLAEVLRLRPDASPPLAGPSSVEELASRLAFFPSVAHALGRVDVRALEIAEVLQALDDGASRDRLDGLVASVLPPGELEEAVRTLERLALVWFERDGTLHLPEGMRQLVAAPLGLGAPLRRLLSTMTADPLRSMLTAIGVKPAGRKDDNLARLVAHLSRPKNVRTLVDSGPPAARRLLRDLAFNGPLLEQPSFGYGYRSSSPGNPGVDWAQQRALLLRRDWNYLELPREVGWALRGEDWHPPFTPAPPPLSYVDVSPEAVSRQEAAAAAEALDTATALLDAWSETPVAVLKAGGVGARELRRLAKELRVGEDVVALWLEVSAAAGLLMHSHDGLLVTEAYDEWRAAAPAERLAPLLTAWWSLPHSPTHRLDASGSAIPALAGKAVGGNAGRRLRSALLELAGAWPGRGVASTDVLVEQALWRHPLVHPATDEDRALGRALAGAAWSEAELLGVVAASTRSGLGAALQQGDEAAVEEHARVLLPAAQTKATFQADLTAVVPGAPAAPLTELLNRAAQLEQRGAAAVWRFTPTSVRAAFDAGTTADALLADLAAVATRELPQPLVYLVRDVARRHGQVRVRPVTCCVTSTDEALLSEITAHRALAALSLRRLAPTVVASGKSVAETLTALRTAGYAPVGETAAGTAQVERVQRRRASSPKPARGRSAPSGRPVGAKAQPKPPTPEKIAKRLLAAPRSKPRQSAPGRSPAAGVLPFPVGARGADDRLGPADSAVLTMLAPQLAPYEAVLLRRALGFDEPIALVYEDSGRLTEVVLYELELEPPHLLGFSDADGEDVAILLSSIRGVAPVLDQ